MTNMEELRKQLAEILNTNTLPFECKFYVLKDVFNEANNIYKDLLLQQEQQVIQKNNTNVEENISELIEDSKEEK